MYETLLGVSVPSFIVYSLNLILNSISVKTSKSNFIIKNALRPLEEEPSILFSTLEKMNNSSLQLCGAATANQTQYRAVAAHIQQNPKGRHCCRKRSSVPQYLCYTAAREGKTEDINGSQNSLLDLQSINLTT
jgi:hypothetical protein